VGSRGAVEQTRGQTSKKGGPKKTKCRGSQELQGGKPEGTKGVTKSRKTCNSKEKARQKKKPHLGKADFNHGGQGTRRRKKKAVRRRKKKEKNDVAKKSNSATLEGTGRGF